MPPKGDSDAVEYSWSGGGRNLCSTPVLSPSRGRASMKLQTHRGENQCWSDRMSTRCTSVKPTSSRKASRCPETTATNHADQLREVHFQGKIPDRPSTSRGKSVWQNCSRRFGGERLPGRRTYPRQRFATGRITVKTLQGWPADSCSNPISPSNSQRIAFPSRSVNGGF